MPDLPQRREQEYMRVFLPLLTIPRPERESDWYRARLNNVFTASDVAGITNAVILNTTTGKSIALDGNGNAIDIPEILPSPCGR